MTNDERRKAEKHLVSVGAKQSHYDKDRWVQGNTTHTFTGDNTLNSSGTTRSGLSNIKKGVK